jgi:PAS domain S-box-containing protein
MQGISRLDTDGPYTMVKDGYARLVGYTPEEMIGRSWDTTVPEEDHPKAIEAVVEMQASGRSEVECRGLRKDGSLFQKRLLLVRIDNKDGQNIGHYCFMNDVTHRVREEEEKRLLNADLAQSQRWDSIGRLAGGVAHDFNNILAAIVGNAEVAIRLEDTPDILKHVQTILNSAALAGELCQQLLTLSGKGAQKSEGICLRRSVEEVLTMVALGSNAQVEILCEFHPADVYAIGDRVQASQVTLNLILNAIDASTHGTAVVIRTGKVSSLPTKAQGHFLQTWGNPDRYYAYLEVEESGVGIEHDRLSTVFEPFYTSKNEGHGLGFAAVMGIARSHDGALELESQKDSGSRFRVYFPLSEKSASASAASDAPVDKLDSWVRRVVVADDEAPIRLYLNALIERDGASVQTFDNGQDALDDVLAHGADLVILDFSMPKLDGIQVAKAVREKDIDVPNCIDDRFPRA